MSSEEYKAEDYQAKSKVQQTGEQAVTKVKQVTEKAKTTMKQVAEKPETIAQPGRAESAASTGGQVVGAGLRKVANVITGFAAGFSRGMKAGQPPKQEQAQQTPQTYVVEEEKIEKKVTKE